MWGTVYWTTNNSQTKCLVLRPSAQKNLLVIKLPIGYLLTSCPEQDKVVFVKDFVKLSNLLKLFNWNK